MPFRPPIADGYSTYQTASRRLCGLSRPAGGIFASNPGKKKARPAGGTARQATETGTTGQVTSTSTYNDTITCRSQSIVAKAGLNSRESSYQEHFCAICCSQKVFTPNFSDTNIVELHNKFAELSLLQRHNLFYSRLFFYHRFGDPLFKLLLVGRVAEGRSRR